VIGIFVGTQMSLELVWKMTDALNGLMAIPNLIALILLSPIVFKLTKAYFDQEKSEQTTTGNSAQGQ
jgi:AGCS family alanine or glycine:cation symporter